MEQKTWYVYLLCDPDTEVPFYVGKGTGKRMDTHEHSFTDGNVEKHKVIRRIHADGKQVLKKKLAEFADEQDAFIYEWAMIALHHKHLTNIRPGVYQIQPLPPGSIKEKEYFTFSEASRYLGMGYRTVMNYLKDLEIKTHKFKRDRHTYLAMEDVRRIKGHKEKPWIAGEDKR